MKFNCKRLLAAAFAGVCLVTSFPAATAEAAEDSLTITVRGSALGYDAYRLLDVKVGLKVTSDAGGVHTDVTGCDGSKHTKDCYTYVYTVNNTYRQVLLDAITAMGDTTTADTDSSGTVDDQEIIAYIGTLGEDQTNPLDRTGKIRTFADKVFNAIGSISSDVSVNTSIAEGACYGDTMQWKNKDVPIPVDAQGYYLIAEKSSITCTAAEHTDPCNGTFVNKDGYDSTSLVMLDTAINFDGSGNINVNTKEEVPTVDKSILKEETPVESTTAERDEYVKFQLKGTIPYTAQNFDTYKYIFHDTLSDGLEFVNSANADDEDHGWALTIGGVELTAGDDTYAVTEPDSHCSIEVNIPDVLKVIEDTEDLSWPAFTTNEASSLLVVFTYYAKVTAEAIPGNPGNENEVYIEFSNNPYDEDDSSTTPHDEVKVFTFQLTLNKFDDNNQPLEGAGFTLYKWDTDASDWVTCRQPEAVSQGDSTVKNIFNFEQIGEGYYKLVESTVPDGYNKMSDTFFEVRADVESNEEMQTVKALEIYAVSLDENGLPKAGDKIAHLDSEVLDDENEKATKVWSVNTTKVGDSDSQGIASTNIVNTTGGELPTTGEFGRAVLLYGGLGALGLALILVVIASRKLKDEPEKN